MTNKTTRTSALNDAQERILMHMLGLKPGEPGLPRSYRNHYAAPADDTALPELAELGMVRFCGCRYELRFYEVTEEGRREALEAWKRRRPGKTKRTYLMFLEVRDVHPELTFRDFLTSERYREARERA